ncbi:MAG TPA: hypothetical protein VNJ04_19640 [Gemmatimonadaceae bacterium]|nr:hypothetical protein [Gemmatimonadaceae bacterium]
MTRSTKHTRHALWVAKRHRHDAKGVSRGSTPLIAVTARHGASQLHRRWLDRDYWRIIYTIARYGRTEGYQEARKR